MNVKAKFSNRVLSAILCVAMLITYIPMLNQMVTSASDVIVTIADPATLTRPELVYGNNTLNAGKVTVGKSVSNKDITVNGQTITIDGDNNFLITISQSSQVMGLASQTGVPVDVVFVLDTSGSMDDNNRAETMVTAANSAIKTLMSTNEQNRVAVVAFSSEDYGGGSSNNAAANVLSSLAHYTGDAAETHLQWVSHNGSSTDNNDKVYIAGRDTTTIRVNNQTRTVNAFRHGKNGGTNIQSGIVEGAKILSSVTNTTYTDPITNETVTRIPFLIILSDGQPTYSYDDDTWYDPTVSGDNAASEQGPGSGAYEGNGFLAALTAAYYKGLITEHYYGDKATAENRCFVYTMGVEIEALDDTRGPNNQTVSVVGVNQSLAQITLDPATNTVGDYAAESAKSYWNYGNTAFEDTQDSKYGWKAYWENYLKGNDFDIRIDEPTYKWVWIGEGEEGSGQPNRNDYRDRDDYEDALEEWRNENYELVYTDATYTVTDDSIASSKKYVNGIGYNGGIAYNDKYFAADNVSEMESIFEDLVRTIQEKAISVPTKVTTGNYNFDGYVTFTDPIGDYMEVKDMKGVLADGYFYQGKTFAEKLSKYGSADADAEFDSLIVDVVKSRMNLTENVVDIEDFAAKVLASKNQAYYNGPDDYDNSIVWWGGIYDSDKVDEQVQVLGFADNDTIEYIEAQKAAGTIPQGADYVCRSYFFYGEAGGANPNPDHTYMYFMVRVQRELTAPYRETVVISAPASLLSMETVLVSEEFDDNGNPVYKATVEHQQPARVVYEVGLWDTITPENVSAIVSADYTTEKVNGSGSVNYDAETRTYNFFTNDWDRTQSLDSHHRGLAKATFDAAPDNAFYTYQEDTLVVDKDGNAVTSNPAGTTAYYVREYFEWEYDSDNDGTYSATKKTALIEVDIPEDTALIQKDNKWYIPAGLYTASTLVVNGDDTMKDDPATEAKDDGNLTGTSSIVAHPHRTGDSSDSHYTVYLGNNGMLSLVADPYEPDKTISVNLPATATNITDDEGKIIKIGDVLTYTVEVKNTLNEVADITVTDYVPLGTEFVEGSAGIGTDDTGHTKDTSIKPDSNNVLTWVLKDVPVGAIRYVSFQVKVTEAAMSLNAVPGNVTNTATVKIGNVYSINTDTTHNPPHGKTVTDVNNNNIDGDNGFKVGDTLVYHIRFHNTATDNNGKYVVANVSVTDTIPYGTTFISADNGGSYDADTGVITWNFNNMAAGAAKAVSFTVKINASAKINASGTQPEAGEIYLPNTATIVIDSNPDIVLTTNTTENWADVGDISISKTVADGGDKTKAFTMNLIESTGLLEGTYVLKRGTATETVVFEEGTASVTIRHGETLTVKGLPAGAIITVMEDVSAIPGWTPTYNTQSITIIKGAATVVSSVSVVNTYTLQPLTITVKGEKNMNGTLPSQATFGFVAEPDASNPIVGGPLTGEVTVKASSKYQFTLSPKTFTTPGTYKYNIHEINGGVHGVTYDSTNYVLVITVKDNGNGTMSATATLNGNAFDLNNGAVSFTNIFTPDDVPLTVTANKTLMVYDAVSNSYKTATVSKDQFHFQITEKSSGNVVTSGSTADGGKINFGTFYFSADMLGGNTSKDITFVVSEIIPDIGKDPNMLYDTNGYEFVARLALEANGNLSVTVNNDSDGIVLPVTL